MSPLVAFVQISIGKEEKQADLFVKSINDVGWINDLLIALGMDLTEVDFYAKVAKALIAFELEAVGKSRLANFIPKCYLGLCDTEEKRFFVVALEDLRKKGFIQFDFNNGVDLVYIKPMLTSMATLHAVSYVFATVKSVDWMQFFPNMNSQPQHLCHASVEKVINDGVNIYMKLDNPDKQARLETFASELLDAWAKLLANSSHKCLVHGDFWATNILRRPEDDSCMMLDFQLTSCGHPMAEIGVAMLYNPVISQAEGHRYELLEHYYNTFNKIVKELDVEKKVAPFWESFEEIRKEFDTEGYINALRFALPRSFLLDRYDFKQALCLFILSLNL